MYMLKHYLVVHKQHCMLNVVRLVDMNNKVHACNLNYTYMLTALCDIMHLIQLWIQCKE